MYHEQNSNFNYPIKVDLANAYVPTQIYQDNFSPQVGLKKGTLFPELYRPY